MDLDQEYTIAIAEGILVERHRITPTEAGQILAGPAEGDGVAITEAADWLILTRTS